MTMLIACLLIYHFNMAWWYGIAAVIWIGYLLANPMVLSIFDN